MDKERRGGLALAISLVLAVLNLIGFWIAGLLLVFTYLLAFHDLYLSYEQENKRRAEQ